MIEAVNRTECTGCGACANVCTVNAISMVADNKGFKYPLVNHQLCIQCGLCLKRCPSVQKVKVDNNFKTPKVWAAWSKQEDIRINSTSGGVFSELAKEILNRGGRVVGARYREDKLVEHYMIDSVDELEILRQSKYTQSDIGFIFRQVKDALLKDIWVLFVGSPCEVAGLRQYLGKDYEKLVLCDFVCRGTNSPKAYMEYLSALEKRYGSPIQRVWFKNKSKGWNLFSTKIIFQNGEEYIEDRNHDAFMLGYIHYNMYMRDCCNRCKYKALPRIADITLADFWGVGNYKPELDEDKGTSLVMINSTKGNELFLQIQDSVFAEECNLEWAIKGNSCILNNATKNKYSDAFFEELGSIPFDKLITKYVKKNRRKTLGDVISKLTRVFRVKK